MGANSLNSVGLPDRYELVRHIANGGMASVWCADDVVLGRRVAIKLLDERFQHDEVAVRRFKREARAAARLSAHRHVVTIYDVAESNGRAVIVMEHMAGGTVAGALRAGPVPREEALRWLHQAADALDHAHRSGVVHRDIKPGNLLLDGDRVLHIGDFGIARLATEDSITGSGELLGTAAYLSPEQALGQPATPASDRYALTVAAFELLTGERPFAAEHFAAQARQHIDDEPPRASERNNTLPATLDAVLVRGMAKAPDERWSTAQALVAAIETALAPSLEPPITQAMPTSAPTRRLAAAPLARRAAAAPVAGPAANPAARPVSPAPGARPQPAAPADLPQPATPAARPRSATPAAQRGAKPAAAARPRVTGPGNRPPSANPAQSQRRRRIGALAALAAVALTAAILAGGFGHTNSNRAPMLHAAKSTGARATHAATARQAPRAAAAGPSRGAAAATSTSGTAPTSPGTAVASEAPVGAAGASGLEARGHQLMLDGSYGPAIDVLRQAVAAAAPGSLTYAYALYDLGHSLRLSGNPKAAIPILEQRLQIPNQTGIVSQELQLAQHAAGG